MPARRRLQFALALSLLAHLLGLLSPGAVAPGIIEREGEAARLEAVLAVAAPAAPAVPAPSPPASPRPGASQATMPAVAASAPSPEPAQSAAADESAIEPSDAPEPPQTADIAEVPVAEADPDVAPPPPPAFYAAERLPRQGRVRYTGSGGGFITLGLGGEARWQHDGVNLHSRLSAGINSLDGQFEYESQSLLLGEHIVSVSSRDRRLSKISSARIEQAAGVVHLQRGEDRRERSIKGLAVAISALPQVMQTLDETHEKIAFFVVGDFWVEDAVLVAGQTQRLSLPQGAVEARHYQTRTNNGSQIDIWLAPAWRNAPVRIRIELDGWVIDLQADEVEIDGQILLEAPPEPEL